MRTPHIAKPRFKKKTQMIKKNLSNENFKVLN